MSKRNFTIAHQFGPELKWLFDTLIACRTIPFTGTVSEWARLNVRLPGSAMSAAFNPDLSPWTREVIDRIDDGATRKITLVKPVQTGGSVVGEVAICYIIAMMDSGSIHYNWENDIKAAKRWDERIERVLLACRAIRSKISSNPDKWKRAAVMFNHMNLTVQGTKATANLESASVRFVLNEEVHAWEPGRLQLSYNRARKFWNSLILNISNASVVGDQLHGAFLSGTQQHWEVPCPACGQFHAMFAKAEKGKVGGLKYDADGARLAHGEYDYSKLAPTIRYEFPCCGHTIPDDLVIRRRLSNLGRYSAPRNPAPNLADRSYTYESVSCHDMSWLRLIEEKHTAIREKRRGNEDAWVEYIQRSECRFFDPNERSEASHVAVNPELVKSPGGLEGRKFRIMTCDRQAGRITQGDTPHYWHVVRDWMENGDSQLVSEGRIETPDLIEAKRIDLGIAAPYVMIDARHETADTFRLCGLYGWTPVMGDKVEKMYKWKGKKGEYYRIFQPMSQRATYDCQMRTPEGEKVFVRPIMFNSRKLGERLEWIRRAPGVKWDVPSDVSEEYKKHLSSWEERMVMDKRTGRLVPTFVQIDNDDHMRDCEKMQLLFPLEANLFDDAAASGKSEVAA